MQLGKSLADIPRFRARSLSLIRKAMDMLRTTRSVADFNPEESARTVKERVDAVNRMTVEAVAEIYRARDYYSGKGRNQYSSVPSGTKLTSFESYLSAAGLARRTAYNWLDRYIPEENKLLTYEEFTEKKEAEKLVSLSKEERQRTIIAEYRRTGTKLPGWNSEIEDAVRRTDDAEARRKAQREKEEQERGERAKNYQREYNLNNNDTPQSNAFKAASDALIYRLDQQAEWKEKIRLSDGGKESAFMDAIIEYLGMLPDDNRKIEACTNIIKICRNISIELQRKVA